MSAARRARRLAAVAAAILISGALGVGMLRWSARAQWSEFEESADFLANEERGYYSIVGARISDGAPLDAASLAAFARGDEDETLELVQIHIGEYRNGPVSESGLAQIRSVLETYRSRDVKLIVRFLYDWAGLGMEADPISLGVVLTHMEQAGDILREYADQIYIIQGVFVGSWAEMHSSRYLSPDGCLTLIRTMYDTMPETAFLAVRTPAYWRAAAQTRDPTAAAPGTGRTSLAQRLSLFNDGMLGNDTDCGTYGVIEPEDSQSLTDEWTPDAERAFQNALCRFVPNGGEVVIDNPLNDLAAADRALRTMHVSYLNGAHDPSVMEKWKQSVWRQPGSVYDGMPGYEYIERHLGYRYVIRSAQVQRSAWVWQSPVLTLEIENVGYANRYTTCTAELLVRNCETGHTDAISLDTDVRAWESGEVTVLRVPLALESGVRYELSLRVTGQDGKPVLFANRDIAAGNGAYRIGTLEKTDGLFRDTGAEE